VPVLLAPVFGPIIGGLIVDEASWQWLFVGNLPIAGAAIVVAAVALTRNAGRGDAGRLDVVGVALLCSAWWALSSAYPRRRPAAASSVLKPTDRSLRAFSWSRFSHCTAFASRGL
jgi:MFS family permease